MQFVLRACFNLTYSVITTGASQVGVGVQLLPRVMGIFHTKGCFLVNFSLAMLPRDCLLSNFTQTRGTFSIGLCLLSKFSRIREYISMNSCEIGAKNYKCAP